jgi:ABC-type proline/glycine betaine transport system permease subunit
MMFSLAGIISYKMLPKKPTNKQKLMGALSMALLFALVESFLAGTSNHSFMWVYKWWGVIPVFITTYIPFFLACNYVPFWEKKKQTRFLAIVWGAVALCLVTLIPLGII